MKCRACSAELDVWEMTDLLCSGCTSTVCAWLIERRGSARWEQVNRAITISGFGATEWIVAIDEWLASR